MSDLPLSAADLAGMRDCVEALILTDTCTLLAAGTTTSEPNGGTVIGPDTETPSACNAVPDGGAERIVGARLAATCDKFLELPWDSPITVNHRVRWAGTEYGVKHIESGTELLSLVVGLTRSA